MKWGRLNSPAIPALGLISSVAFVMAATPSPPVTAIGPAPIPPPPFARVGVNSCAARGCHGAVGPVEPSSGDVFIEGGAYTTWRAFDPHARAEAALLEPRSIAIAARLGGSAPEKSRLCLSCHATPGEGPSAGLRGIDCEGCHGPAGKWGEAHLALDWITLKPVAKAESGFRDLTTPRNRAESCVGCHVGDRSRGMEVNHDLIAAGHPRLNFDYAAYLAALPKHWREEDGPADREAKSWAVGQAVTARAVVRLLGERAKAAALDDPATPWPEFSESECFACHHVPANPSPRPARDPKAIGPGRLPWATWTSATLLVPEDGGRPDLSRALADLRAEMSRPGPVPSKVVGLAETGLSALGASIDALEASKFDAGRVDALIARLTRPEPSRVETWDEEARRYLTIEALSRASKALGGTGLDQDAARLIESAPNRLAFPPGYDSPREGRPRPILP